MWMVTVESGVYHLLPWYESARRHWMISLPDTLWGYIGSLGMLECEEMKSPTSSQGTVLFNGLLDLSLSWGSLGRIRRKMKSWMEKQHLVLWCGPCSTQRWAGELTSGPNLSTRVWLLSFNRTQSRVVFGLLTGHNTLRRHLYIMGLSNNATCRKCGTEEETSFHILCECVALASLRYTHLGSFFLDPEDIRKLSIGAIWNFGKGTWHL